MYAVIQSGGKQYRVAVGDRLRVEKLAAEQGATVEIDRVLMVADGAEVTVGTPTVDGKPVTARVVGHGRGEKIKVFKRKRRKGYRRTQGHRQSYTELEVLSIAGSGAAASGQDSQTTTE